MTKAEKKKLTEVYNDCLAGDIEYKKLCVQQDDEFINLGWIEALEFVFNLEKQLKSRIGYKRVQAKFRKKLK